MEKEGRYGLHCESSVVATMVCLLYIILNKHYNVESSAEDCSRGEGEKISWHNLCRVEGVEYLIRKVKVQLTLNQPRTHECVHSLHQQQCFIWRF